MSDQPVEQPFLSQFSRLAIANILSNLMVPLAGIIDIAFLGHLAEIHYLAGVAIATVIFNVVYWSFGFLRMATTGLTAQARGRGDLPGLRLVLLRHGLLAWGLGVGVLLLQVPLRQAGFALLNADPVVQLAGEAFFNARIWGAPAVLLNYVLLGWFLGCGQGRRVILLSLVGNGGNILLDYLFIRQFGWASAGAGAATALSQGLMLLAGLVFVWQDVTPAQLWQLRPQVWEGSALRGIFRLNRDILVRTFAIVISFALFTNWSAAMGTGILTANTLLLQVVTLTSYFIDGLAFATETFAGQFYGAGDRTRLRTLLTWGLGLSSSLSGGIALTFMLWPRPLFSLMTQHQDVLDQATHYVGWLFPTLGFGGLAFLLDGYFLGLTAGSLLRNSTFAAMLIGFLPLGLLAAHHGWPQVLWLALASFMAVRALTLLWQVPVTLRPAHLPEQVTTPTTP